MLLFFLKNNIENDSIINEDFIAYSFLNALYYNNINDNDNNMNYNCFKSNDYDNYTQSLSDKSKYKILYDSIINNKFISLEKNIYFIKIFYRAKSI